MFSKVSVRNLVYDLTDVFMFPTDKVKKIYEKYKINKYYLGQNLTDTDSTSMFFIFACDLNCNIKEDISRDILFEVMIASKIFDRLDLSAEYFEKFNCRKESLKKKEHFLK